MSTTIPREFIELLLAKIDIVDLINIQIPLKKKSGSNYFACCPFHNEKSASFSVSQPKQFYYCFGCGAHGNAIDFVMQQDHLNFPEAVETLARQVGMEVPRQASAIKRDDSLIELYAWMPTIVRYYYQQLRQSPRAIDYLKNRGISGKIAKQFQLGYAPPGWSHLFEQFGHSELEKKKLLDMGLIIKKNEGGYYDRFRDRIMFPIYDYRGRVIGFGGRVLDTGEPKYLNSPETILFQKGHELYGLYQALKYNRKLQRVMIVEGYMDVTALFQYGISYAVATLGTATTSQHLQRLLRYTTDIVFCFDGDAAGRTAAWRALQVLLPSMQDSLQVRYLFLPEGDDPDSLIRKEGKLAFEQRLDSAMSLSAFFFSTLAKQSDMNTMEGRARFAATALDHIKQLPATLFQGILLEELGKRVRIATAELTLQLKQARRAPAQHEPAAIAPVLEQPKVKLTKPMRLIIALLLQQPSLTKLIQLSALKNTLPGYNLLARLIEVIDSNSALTTGALMEYWREQPEAALIAELALWQHMIAESDREKALLTALRRLVNAGLDEEINSLLAKAAQEGLSTAEKQMLSTQISQRKSE